jgi:predicted nucleic acid-binding protein
VIGNVLLDTGPLIAILDRRDQYHPWALEQFRQIVPPLLTCEAVLAEACHLMKRAGQPAAEPLALVTRGVLRLAFQLGDNTNEVMSLLTQYENVPMSLADACLVRMSEIVPDCMVLTLDQDFRIHRRNRRKSIPVLMPKRA